MCKTDCLIVRVRRICVHHGATVVPNISIKWVSPHFRGASVFHSPGSTVRQRGIQNG